MFEKFWTPSTMMKIIKETNLYASMVKNKETRETYGSIEWTPLEYHEFKALLAIILYMEIKKLPNIRCYWALMTFVSLSTYFTTSNKRPLQGNITMSTRHQYGSLWRQVSRKKEKRKY